MKRYIPKINDMVYSEGYGVCRVVAVCRKHGLASIQDVYGIPCEIHFSSISPVTEDTCRKMSDVQMIRRYAMVGRSRQKFSMN